LSDYIEISLKTDVGRVPPNLKVSIGDEIVFNDLLDNDKIIKHQTQLSKRLVIQIEKSGKTKSVADANEPQSVLVEKISLNGLDQHASKFGVFEQKDNSYVKDQKVNGNEMALNGTWRMDVPVFRQPFIPELNGHQRNAFSDARVACFGCSFTYGNLLEYNQTWPHFLGDGVKNFGVGGNSISSIVGTANWYVQNFKCDKLVMLLPHVCRLQYQVNKKAVMTFIPFLLEEYKGILNDVQKEIVMFGEPSLMFSGYITKTKELMNKINQKTDLYLSSYQKDTYDFLTQEFDGISRILPFYDLDEKFSLAPDNLHPGPDHNRIFANQIRPIIGG